MRHFIIAAMIAAGLALPGQAQNNVTFMPGKLAVCRGGDGVITIASGRQHPVYVDEYDPALTNQANPILTVALPTNGNGALFINAHAGSEGQGMTRSSDRQFLAVMGYNGDLNSIPGTPSSATNSSGQGYARGFGTINAFGNYSFVYGSANWFGLQPGITQNNPRGLATDGSNDFWGCGTIAGTQSGGFAETGTLFYNGSDPYTVQSLVNSAYFLRIINGVLYMVCLNENGGAQNNGLYDFVDFSFNGGGLVPLPYAPGNVSHVVTTNLFLNAGSTYANLKSFDMNPAGNIAYLADTTLGIAKFVNTGGSWTAAYLFNSNNIGSGAGSPHQPKGATGCFGIAVDFSGAAPVIYATTMDSGDGTNTCSNRLISIIDTGAAPGGTQIVAQNLATAHGNNEVFRGLDFTPDLRPLITAQPVSTAATTNQPVIFSVGAQSVYTAGFQWQLNGTNVTDNSNITGSATANLAIAACVLTNQGNYTVVVTNQYGSVTSLVANLSVSTVPVLPSWTNAVGRLTNFVGNNQTFSINPKGTPPFQYQWYFGATALVDDGIKYNGSSSGSLNITNLQTADAGSYYLVISNQAGSISNLAYVLSVQFVAPTIMGQPSSSPLLAGQSATLSVTGVGGTAPLVYQWYQGSLSNSLSDLNEFSGTATPALTITAATTNDAAGYFCVISNGGGTATSQVAMVSVIVPPALSYVAYSNQIYRQNFDSLPDPGPVAVNTISGGGPVTIGGITYDVGNPFDFAYPLFTNLVATPGGGLNLSNTLSGWYGECDGDAHGGQLGASDGSQTTGGVISFGTLDSGHANRALGLIATSTSGATHFGLKLLNASTNVLNFVSLSYTGEYWKIGTRAKTLSFGYTIDGRGNAATLDTNEIANAQANEQAALDLSFATGTQVGPVNGNLAINQSNMIVTNLPLAVAWPPGSALWLVWSINDAGGSGQGYAIDNLSFAAGNLANVSLQSPISPPTLAAASFNSGNTLAFTFTNAPGASGQFTIWSTTNLAAPLAQWSNLGNPVEIASGQYQFLDTHATNTQRFYTVTSP